MVPILAHTLVVVVLVASYTVLTVTGHDGTALLGVLGGYLAGAGFQSGLTKASNASSSP